MSGKQLGFGNYEQATGKKRSKHEKFLAEMEAVALWKGLIDLIEPHYPKLSSIVSQPAYPMATMLRIHRAQKWYLLGDPAKEDALI